MNIFFINLTTITPCCWYSGGLHATQAVFTDVATQTHATAQCFVLGVAPFDNDATKEEHRHLPNIGTILQKQFDF
jgi:hypothetical protein